jgi:hypothetical protein
MNSKKDVSMITILSGQDEIIRRVEHQTKLVQRLVDEQRVSRPSLQYYCDNHDFLQTSRLDELEKQRQAEVERNLLAEALNPRMAAKTSYDDQGKLPCDPNTRTAFRERIRNWVYDISSSSPGIFWLTGDPGSGKSALAASVARFCKDDDILWAQYFINRSIDQTTQPTKYFPSIARQLADRSPEVRHGIYSALQKEKSLLDNFSVHQAQNIFTSALKEAVRLDPSKPVVVIIDGLDETDPKQVRNTAEVFRALFQDIPQGAKVMITSRTDECIRHTFSSNSGLGVLAGIHLDTAEDSSIRDVAFFLEQRLESISNCHGIMSWKTQWFREERFQDLCNHAAGLFIWAVTVLNFIEDQIENWGPTCLDYILPELIHRDLDGINDLYSTILRLTHRGIADEALEAVFRHVVGAIIVLQEPLSVGNLKDLLQLDVRHEPNSVARPVDLKHFVSRLRTVLVPGREVVTDATIPRVHNSFREFITAYAEERFRVKVDASHREIGEKCLHRLSSFSRQTLDTHPDKAVPLQYFPVDLRYACLFWAIHLRGDESPGVLVENFSSPEGLSRLTSESASYQSANIIFYPNKRKVLTGWNGFIRR